jgi:hypothetical protein
MQLNPLTWGLAGLRRALYLGHGDGPMPGAAGAIAVGFAVSAGFAAMMLVVAARLARAPVAADLQ